MSDEKMVIELLDYCNKRYLNLNDLIIWLYKEKDRGTMADIISKLEQAKQFDGDLKPIHI